MNISDQPKKRPPLFIWREVPIDVDEEMYLDVIKNWGNNVYVISVYGLPKERTKVGITTNIDTIVLHEKKDADKYVRSLIENNSDAIHVFAGMRGEIWKYAKYCNRMGNHNIATIGERPNRQFSIILIAASFLINHYRHFRYSNIVKVRIQMGSMKSVLMNRYGWKKNVLFPFMYCPNSQIIQKGNKQNKQLKFLYLGRFSKKYKGIDYLLNATKELNGTDWSLTLVGRYGDDVEYVDECKKTNNNIIISDAWPQSEIVEKMSEYDVVVIPSSYDGWNLNVNYAIQANIGCIVTDQAGSDALVVNRKTGLIIKNQSSEEIRNAMQFVIDNRDVLAEWKRNVEKLTTLVTPQIVARYFISILDYAFLEGKERPVCPWDNLERIFE